VEVEPSAPDGAATPPATHRVPPALAREVDSERGVAVVGLHRAEPREQAAGVVDGSD
jgi:hypothetical protein